MKLGMYERMMKSKGKEEKQPNEKGEKKENFERKINK